MTTWPRTRQTLTFAAETSNENCACEFCRRNKSFQAPSELLDAFLEGTIVIFAGAGISTEAKGVMPNTLYTEINHALGNKNSDQAFPDLMEDFCSTPAGKIGLIQESAITLTTHTRTRPCITMPLASTKNSRPFTRQIPSSRPIGTTISSNTVPLPRLLRIEILPCGPLHSGKSSRSMARYQTTGP